MASAYVGSPNTARCHNRGTTATQNPGHSVAGRLDDNLVLPTEAAAETLQTGTGHADTSGRTQLSIFPEHHLGKGSVKIHANHASHQLLLLCCIQWEQWATRQLRIRALGATGSVAGAASY
jgi:hypothetical protein